MKRLLLVFLIAALGVLPAGARTASPDEVIREAVDLLEEGLNGRRDELAEDKEALYAFINGILLPRFEREIAARAVLARHWRKASVDEQNRFIDAFYTTLVRRYAEGILEFETDRVDILPYKGDPKDRTPTVKTNVRLDDGTRIPVHYDLVKSKEDGSWRMFNVKIEGVSYVVNYRKELDAEIKASSLGAVIERLENEAGIVHDE